MKAWFAFLMILLASCSASNEGGDAADAADTVRDPSVFDPLVGTIDRAQGVEDTLADSAAERRRRVDESEAR